jgi:hypothetical protein
VRLGRSSQTLSLSVRYGMNYVTGGPNGRRLTDLMSGNGTFLCVTPAATSISILLRHSYIFFSCNPILNPLSFPATPFGKRFKLLV